MISVNDSNLPIAGGVLAGLAGGLCCAGPLVLLLLGISGSWIATLTLLEPYQPFFMIAVAGAFGYSGWQFFRPIEQCVPGSACAIPRIRRRWRADCDLVSANHELCDLPNHREQGSYASRGRSRSDYRL